MLSCISMFSIIGYLATVATLLVIVGVVVELAYGYRG